MDTLGINFNILLIQIFSVLLFACWVFFLVFAFNDMKKRKLTGPSLYLWIVVLLILPLLGAMLYWFTFKPSIERQ